jgi:hypothetical protein
MVHGPHVPGTWSTTCSLLTCPLVRQRLQSVAAAGKHVEHVAVVVRGWGSLLLLLLLS